MKDPNCNMEAHIDSSTQIRITWDTSLASKYDNVTMDALFEMNLNRGGKTESLGNGNYEFKRFIMYTEVTVPKCRCRKCCGLELRVAKEERVHSTYATLPIYIYYSFKNFPRTHWT